MAGIGFLFCLFGILVILQPDIVAYFVAFFFLVIGINLLIASRFFARPNNSSWKVGSYEIHRKK